MSIILGILGKIGIGKLFAFVFGGAVIAPLFFIIKERIADGVEKMVGKELAKLFNPNIDNPKEKELVIAIVQSLVNYAEYKLPNGMGEEKFAFVKAYLEKFIPEKYAMDIVDLIEECVKRLDDELKKNVK
jgi:hypothetical protein